MKGMWGLKPIDLSVIVAYFVAVTAVGFWAARRVKGETDFFLGGRRFGKGLLVMHWLCTGTHSEQAVQVAGATARVGLGGIWYQWMWLFSTPFYWLIAPIMRRLRVITTGDVFRIRYGRSLEILYSLVSMAFFILSIAMLLRGAGTAIAGATGGEIPSHVSIIVLSILFSSYIMAGGLIAAAYTDFLQGILIIALSVMLVPAGLNLLGGFSGLHQVVSPERFGITAPPNSPEGDIGFVIAMSILGLVGIVAQPHVMTATGSGKTETEARVGMCYGNFIKRLLTIAWAFTGLIAAARFPINLVGLDENAARQASEQLFGLSIREFLGDGWRGLMIACLIAGVTSAETIMVVGSAMFTRNFYVHAVKNRTDRHYLWTGRIAAGVMLALAITVSIQVDSVTTLYHGTFKLIGLVGPAFWMGIVWRRANAPAAWASFLAGTSIWLLTSTAPASPTELAWLGFARDQIVSLGELLHLRHLGRAGETLVMLGAEFGFFILAALLTRPQSQDLLNGFFARLHTPVGQEHLVRWATPDAELPESCTLGMEGVRLDYQLACRYAYAGLRRFGLEIPRMTRFDWGGFLLAWLMVGGLIWLLYILSSWGGS